ncbi:hypothetical protein GP419_002617, partial [Enterococcus faecalis]|nr:hypothetical protein [Enterococcus faecalis]
MRCFSFYKCYSYIIGLFFLCFFSNIVANADTIPDPPSDALELYKVFETENMIGDGQFLYNQKVLKLTDGPNNNTAIWAKKQLDFNKDWTMGAYLYLGNVANYAADGLTLTFQEDSKTAIGVKGGGLGAYKGSISASALSLELDSYKNSDTYDFWVTSVSETNGASFKEFSYKGQHMGIVRHSYVDNHNFVWIPKNKLPKGLSDGAWKKLNVNWDSSKRIMYYSLLDLNGTIIASSKYEDSKAFVDGASKDTLLNKKMYWGFTGASGLYGQAQGIAFVNTPQSATQVASSSVASIKEGETIDVTINQEVSSGEWNNRKIDVDFSAFGENCIEYIPGTLRVDGKLTEPNEVTVKGFTIDNLPDLEYKYKDSANVTFKIKGKLPSSRKEILVRGYGQNQYDEDFPKLSSVNLEIQKDPLKVVTESQIVELGLSNEKQNYILKKSLNVYYNSAYPLDANKYSVEILKYAVTDTIGNKKATVKVTLHSDKSKVKIVDVPITINWGNSVVYGSYDYWGDERTSAAFTLYLGQTPTIVASQGKNDDNLAIHSNFTNQQYYTFNWFNLSNKDILKMDEGSNGDKFIKANGSDLKKDKLKKWGIAQKQVVNYGDVVRSWQIETGKNWLYENEQKQTYNDEKKSAYYEISTSGYRPLHFNQLIPKVGNIPIYSTKQYLDEHVS